MTPRVTVVTDSAASIPPELVEGLGIVVVPMSVIIGGTPHPDGELSIEEVMARTGEGVSTSGPSPGEVLQAVEGREGDVLLLTVSRQMSSTFKAANAAARMVGDRARVMDTGTAAGAEGLVVLAAAEAAARGAPVDVVQQAARRVIERVRLIATVDSLDRLVQSGRVPGVAGLASRWLGMQPLFEFRDGLARPLRPAFSREAALERMLTAWRQSTVPNADLHVAALHAQAEGDAAALLDAVREEVKPVTAFAAPFSAVMVAHTGMGLVGLSWWWDEEQG